MRSPLHSRIAGRRVLVFAGLALLLSLVAVQAAGVLAPRIRPRRRRRHQPMSQRTALSLRISRLLMRRPTMLSRWPETPTTQRLRLTTLRTRLMSTWPMLRSRSSTSFRRCIRVRM